MIFASGFKSGTPRIRNKINTSIFYSSASVKHDKIILVFEKWLAGTETLFTPFFWGDLDFSGMAILSSLKKVFPTVKAWETGYIPMLDMLEHGGGHTPKEAGKDNQDDPGMTGCNYADKALLPLLRRKKRFLDQE